MIRLISDTKKTQNFGSAKSLPLFTEEMIEFQKCRVALGARGRGFESRRPDHELPEIKRKSLLKWRASFTGFSWGFPGFDYLLPRFETQTRHKLQISFEAGQGSTQSAPTDQTTHSQCETARRQQSVSNYLSSCVNEVPRPWRALSCHDLTTCFMTSSPRRSSPSSKSSSKSSCS